MGRAVKPVVSVAARVVAAYYTGGASEALYAKYRAAQQRPQVDITPYFPEPLTQPNMTEMSPLARQFQYGQFATDVLRNVPIVGGPVAGAIEGEYSDEEEPEEFTDEEFDEEEQ